MNVNLTPELDQMVNEKVKSGLYNSASEVVRDALRLMQEKDELRQARLAQLRKEIDIGYQQYLRGELVTVDVDEMFSDVKKRVKAKRS